MDLSRLRKVESPAPRLSADGVEGTMTAIVKVLRGGYRPTGIKVRSEISPEIFTAEFPAEILAALDQDPEVASISLTRPLQVQTPKP